MKLLDLALASTLVLGFAAPAQAADGAALFKTLCASCHGEKGDGDTMVGKAMNVPSIAGLSADTVTKHVGEAANHAAVKDKVSAEDLHTIAALIAGMK